MMLLKANEPENDKSLNERTLESGEIPIERKKVIENEVSMSIEEESKMDGENSIKTKKTSFMTKKTTTITTISAVTGKAYLGKKRGRKSKL